ncbi:MAG: tetratricopeptide repeat protein [Candidatus Methanoperedens sp.]|nr:tetratricopeptide repeat protein [Candidatus Methanoperedens sp.]
MRGKATRFNNIAGVYRQWGKLQLALEYFQKALEIDEKLKDIRGKAARFNNIGGVYLQLGKLAQALEYFQKALGIYEELKDIKGKATSLNNIACVTRTGVCRNRHLNIFKKRYRWMRN